MKKLILLELSIFALLLIAGALFCYFRYYFVFGEGVKSGELNYVVHKGFIFKTYEGKMIQTGYNSRNTSATIQSNEFKFSVEDERVAHQIEYSSSRQIKLHWKRYLGVLPWRGNSQYVVDSVISVRQAAPKMEDDLLEMPLPVEN